MTLKAVSSNAGETMLASDESALSGPRKLKLHPSLMSAGFASLVSKPLKSFYNRIAPVGYEDERGFHYGEP